jgi:hypothetical protein
MEYVPNTPKQFGKLVETQLGIWAQKVHDAGIRPQ